jgi:hypothetical protein
MKYLILLLFFISIGASAQPAAGLPEIEALQQELDRVHIDRLLAISRESHRGKRVQDFLESEQIRGYTDLIFRYTPAGEIDYLMLQYSPKVFLSIYIHDASAIKEAAAHPQQALVRFRQEEISKIGVRFIMLQEGSASTER